MLDHRPDPSDADLRRLCDGDEQAFRALVEAHEAVVLGLCQSLGLRGADIDEAAAEVFIDVYRALPRFEGRSQLGTWIYRIAFRNIRRYRHRSRRREQVERAADSTGAKFYGSDPAILAQTDELDTRLWQAVSQLEPRQSAAVELYYRWEMTIQEIADVLTCPGGTVKTLLFRARERLRDVLVREGMMP
jgi:RNA polymerase sigma-70 factor (ECF subfamily)